jgi:hypothetical protein
MIAYTQTWRRKCVTSILIDLCKRSFFLLKLTLQENHANLIVKTEKKRNP